MIEKFENIYNLLETPFIIIDSTYVIKDYNLAAKHIIDNNELISDIICKAYWPIFKNGISNRFPFTITEKRLLKSSTVKTTSDPYKLIIKPLDNDMFMIEFIKIGSMKRANYSLIKQNREFIKHSSILTELIQIKSGKNKIENMSSDDIISTYEEQLKLQFSIDDAVNKTILPIIDGNLSVSDAANIVLTEMSKIINFKHGYIITEEGSKYKVMSKIDKENLFQDIFHNNNIFNDLKDIKKSIFYNNMLELNDFKGLEYIKNKISNLMIVPLTVEGINYGHILLSNCSGRFNEMHLKISTRLGQLFSLAIQRSEYLLELHKLANNDVLTGCFNRRYFKDVLAKLYKKVKLEDSSFLLIFFDINNLKTINDELGHDSGDDLIKSFADIIKNTIREKEIFARYGGDEFILLLPDLKLSHAQTIKARINRKINIFNNSNNKPFKISASMGCVEYNKNCNLTMDELIDEADSIMYYNKKKYKEEKYKMPKLFHVDDSNFQRRFANNILSDYFPDSKIISISDAEMLDIVEKNNNDFSDIDIFITDLLMDKISGQDVIKYCRSVNKEICIVVLSSNIQKTEQQKCFANGADYFLEKPLTANKLDEFKVFYDER